MANFIDLITSSAGFIVGILFLFLIAFGVFFLIFWLYHKRQVKKISNNIPLDMQLKINEEKRITKEVENGKEKRRSRIQDRRERELRGQTGEADEVTERTDRDINSEGTGLQKPTATETGRGIQELSSESDTDSKRTVKLHKPESL